MTSYRLSIDLVPGPIWEINLRSDKVGLGKYRWTKLRQSILDARGKSCLICQSVEGPHGHEVWEYTTKGRTGVAKLIRIQIICRMCHQIHHWGLTTKLVAQGLMAADHLDVLVDHFCKINQCKPKDFRQHMEEAKAMFEKRSKMKWTVDWGPYARDVQLACASRN